jgi:hypothetical protein
MSKCFYDNQVPVYRNVSGTTSLTLDSINNQLIIDNTTTGKTILIDSTQFSNGTQSLPYTQMYEKINAVEACVYPAPSATQLQVENSIIVTDTPNNKGISIDAPSPAIQVSDIPSGIQSTITNSFVKVDSAGISGPNATLSSGDITITDFAGTMTTQLTAYYLQFNNSVVTPLIDIDGSNRLELNGNGTSISVNSKDQFAYIGDNTGAGHSTQIIVSDPNYSVDFNNAKNLTATFSSQPFYLPICFSSKSGGSATYVAPSTWVQLHHFSIPFPSLLVDNDNLNTTWKIEFQLQTTNMTDQANKELAIYIDFQDISTNIYTPFLFNQNTPFTTNKNPSTYSASSTQSENYGWTDYVDFSGMNGATPIEFQLWWFANGTNNFDFSLLVTLTRTNLI